MSTPFSLYDYSSGSQGALLSTVVTTGAPYLAASLDPCHLAGAGQCTSTITWNALGYTRAWVFVQDPYSWGGVEQPVTAGVSGSIAMTSIQGSPHQYTFTLWDYSSGSRGANLGSVLVTAVP